MTDKNNLDEIVKKLSKNLPKFINLRTFKNKTKKIINKYDPTAVYSQTGGHSNGCKIEFKNKNGQYEILRICEKQKGSESIISAGVFKNEVTKLARATGIPQNYLASYIKGSGNLYKIFIKKLEEEYEI